MKSQEALLGVIWNKIADKRHIGTKDNPADIGSRGCLADQRLTKWLEGPEWLSNPDDLPEAVTVMATKETEAQARQDKEPLKAVKQSEEDEFNNLMRNYSFSMRITAWVTRFPENLKSREERKKGSLTTEEAATNRLLAETKTNTV